MFAAYIAGFLDGEGNITILSRNRKYGLSYGLHIGFTNRDIRPLLAIQKIYGGNIYEKRRKSLKHSQAFELRVGNREAVGRLLEDVIPYLICKRKQAEVGLAFLSLGLVKKKQIGRRKFHPTKGGSVPILQIVEGEQEKRQHCKAELMALNVRGAA